MAPPHVTTEPVAFVARILACHGNWVAVALLPLTIRESTFVEELSTPTGDAFIKKTLLVLWKFQ